MPFTIQPLLHLSPSSDTNLCVITTLHNKKQNTINWGRKKKSKQEEEKYQQLQQLIDQQQLWTEKK